MYFLFEACENSNILSVVLFIKKLLQIVYILVPIGLILYLSIDLFKAVMAGSEGNKKIGIIIKRLIYTVALFLVPVLVKFAMNLVVSNELLYNTCWEKANIETINHYRELEEAIAKEEEAKAQQNNNSSSTDNNQSSSTSGSSSLSPSNNPTNKTVDKSKTYQFLFVGASKTWGNGKKNSNGIKPGNIPEMFKKVANNSGYHVKVTYYTKYNYRKSATSKKRAATLINFYTYQPDLMKSKYDYVVLNELTGNNHWFDRPYSGVSSISQLVKKYNPNVQIYFRASWIYLSDPVSKRQKVYDVADKINITMLNKYGYPVEVIQDGKSIYAALDQNLKVLQSDNHHQSDTGAYLVSLCTFATVFHEDPTTVTYNAGISKTTTTKLKKIAKQYCYK